MLSNGTNLGLLVDGAVGEYHYEDFMRLLRGLDALVMPKALDILTSPPNSPDNGDVYIVDATGTGAWSGKDNAVTRYSAKEGEWEFYTPHEGWTVYVQSETASFTFNGTAWAAAAGGGTGLIVDGTPAEGDLVYYNGTSWVLLGPGTAGEYLKTMGPAEPPQWAEIPTLDAEPVSDPLLVIAASGAAQSVDISVSTVVDLTLTANCVLTLTGATSGAAFGVTLILRQDATGSRTLTLPTTKWAAGTPPVLSTAADAIDTLTLMTVDGGTTYFGFLGGQAFS